MSAIFVVAIWNLAHHVTKCSNAQCSFTLLLLSVVSPLLTIALRKQPNNDMGRLNEIVCLTRHLYSSCRGNCEIFGMLGFLNQHIPLVCAPRCFSHHYLSFQHAPDCVRDYECLDGFRIISHVCLTITII